MLRRIQQRQPTYNHLAWEQDREVTEQMCERICRFPYRPRYISEQKQIFYYNERPEAQYEDALVQQSDVFAAKGHLTDPDDLGAAGESVADEGDELDLRAGSAAPSDSVSPLPDSGRDVNGSHSQADDPDSPGAASQKASGALLPSDSDTAS